MSFRLRHSAPFYLTSTYIYIQSFKASRGIPLDMRLQNSDGIAFNNLIRIDPDRNFRFVGSGKGPTQEAQ